MKTHPKALAIAVAAALGTLGALPAQALQYTTDLVVFSGSASVIDDEGGGATTTSNALLGTSALSQFDPSLGVLTGTTLNLTSTRTQTVTVTAGHSNEGNNSDSPSSEGTGSSTAKIEAPGVDTTFEKISKDGICTGKRKAGCTSTTSAATDTNANLLSASGSLDSYVGGGTVTVTRTAPTLTATQIDSNFPGAESTTYSIAWGGTLSLTYEYLLHAAPSFNTSSEQLTLDLDFGEVFLGDAVDGLDFSIYNLPPGDNFLTTDRVGLDLYNFDDFWGPFSTNLSLFSSLGSGSGNSFKVFLDTATLGNFSTSYKLYFSDADVGAQSSRLNYEMTLNLRGAVVEQTAAVPEPGALALLGIGLLGMGFARQRKT